MTLDELQEHQRHLRNVAREAETEWIRWRVAENDTCILYMRAVGPRAEGDPKATEAAWRAAQSHMEMAYAVMQQAREDFLANSALIIEACGGLYP